MKNSFNGFIKKILIYGENEEISYLSIICKRSTNSIGCLYNLNRKE